MRIWYPSDCEGIALTPLLPLMTAVLLGMALGLLVGCVGIGWLILVSMRSMTRRVEELLDAYLEQDEDSEPPPKRRCL